LAFIWLTRQILLSSSLDLLLAGFTPNARIPLNTGLCGAAASTGRTVVVDDVSKDSRYLAGSSMVKSEIVVPILVRKKLVAELDIESYFTGAFPKGEQDFVEGCAASWRLFGKVTPIA
jgi:putative methionine-R-sulfoxide reductase with GAF domain